MIDIDRYLETVEERFKSQVEDVLRLAEEVIETRAYKTTGFLDEDEMKAARDVLSLVFEVDSRPFGGYRGASRSKLAIFPTGLVDDSYEPGISFFSVDVPDSSLDESQLVVALRRVAVKMEDVGDIFKTKGGFEGVISKNVIERLFEAEIELDSHICVIREIDLSEVSFPNQREKEIKSSVASLRLDSIAGAGFGASRTRMAEEIKANRIKVNGKLITSSSAKVQEKDVIVAKGRGRILVDEVRGETKKGRIYVILKRFILG